MTTPVPFGAGECALARPERTDWGYHLDHLEEGGKAAEEEEEEEEEKEEGEDEEEERRAEGSEERI